MRWKIWLPPSDGLVECLAPPGDPEWIAEQLTEIRVRWAEAVTREKFDTQPLDQTRAQLRAVCRAFENLGPRALAALAEALAESDLRHAEDYVRVGAASELIDGAQLGSILIRAVEQALASLKKKKAGRRGNLSNVSRHAVRELVDLFCECRSHPRPYFDSTESTVRRNEALVFAYQCLAAWGDDDIAQVTADDLIWSL